MPQMKEATRDDDPTTIDEVLQASMIVRGETSDPLPVERYLKFEADAVGQKLWAAVDALQWAIISLKKAHKPTFRERTVRAEIQSLRFACQVFEMSFKAEDPRSRMELAFAIEGLNMACGRLIAFAR